VLAARTLGIPVALLEVNAVRGAATRWLAPLADRTLHAFPPGPEAGPRSVHTGPPLAPELARGAPGEAERQAARARLGFDSLRPLLVVLGGSQGAGALNAFVRASLTRLAARGVQVLHQTGPGRLAEAAREAPGYRALEYVDPIRPALAAATLVLCRGGASTLCEVAALGVPAFVAPYPLAAGDHQTRNALRLGSGARLVRDAELGEPLADELASLAGAERRAEREARGAALAAALPRDGAARIWDVLADLAGWKAHAREGRIAGGGT
jgi:UDP-N-acetylglucosamine--N-acetylmuramyl-(pentapeptide) pyrophosphoryl-undecaprenol N-acetylglucosamine transferase